MDNIAEFYVEKLEKGLEHHEMVWLLEDIVKRLQKVEQQAQFLTRLAKLG